jgi:hypothetical protein
MFHTVIAIAESHRFLTSFPFAQRFLKRTTRTVDSVGTMLHQPSSATGPSDWAGKCAAFAAKG